MRKLIIVSSVTPNYIPKAIPFFESLEKWSNFTRNMVLVVEPAGTLPKYPSIEFVACTRQQMPNLNANGCPQDGEFLHLPVFDSLANDDVLLWSDADAQLQRFMSPLETRRLLDLQANEVFVGMNEHECESLKDEARKLGGVKHRRSARMLYRAYWKFMPIYNVGVMAAHKSAWKRLNQLYRSLYPLALRTFHHPARQQWLMSYILNAYAPFEVLRMPPSFHSHGHRHRHAGQPHPFADWWMEPYGKLVVKGEVPLFKHRIP